MTYSSASLAERFDALLDPGSRRELASTPANCAARAFRGCLNGRPIVCAGTDPSRTRGAIGVAEATTLSAALAEACSEKIPLLLLLDSAGAKVDEGLEALGAFRRLYRNALHARLTDVPMLALLGRACFGGASMLATVCHSRVYTNRTLIATSGPAVIQALSGKHQLDASDPSAVQALMGGQARSAHGDWEILCADDLASVRRQAVTLIHATQPPHIDIISVHDRLALRLRPRYLPESVHALERLRTLMPAGYKCELREDVVIGAGSDPDHQPHFVGVLTGEAVGTATCWVLADELMKLHRHHPRAPVVLVLDSIGQSASREDEEQFLAQYITHFALTAAWLAAEGHRIFLWIPGQAAGAIYVAFAAPAEKVSALPSAQLRILPDQAAAQIVRNAPARTTDTDVWITSGVTDALLDSRLMTYTAV